MLFFQNCKCSVFSRKKKSTKLTLHLAISKLVIRSERLRTFCFQRNAFVWVGRKAALYIGGSCKMTLKREIDCLGKEQLAAVELQLVKARPVFFVDSSKQNNSAVET